MDPASIPQMDTITEGSPVSSFFKMVPSVVVAHCNIAVVGNSNRASYELL